MEVGVMKKWSKLQVAAMAAGAAMVLSACGSSTQATTADTAATQGKTAADTKEASGAVSYTHL